MTHGLGEEHFVARTVRERHFVTQKLRRDILLHTGMGEILCDTRAWEGHFVTHGPGREGTLCDTRAWEGPFVAHRAWEGHVVEQRAWEGFFVKQKLVRGIG